MRILLLLIPATVAATLLAACGTDTSKTLNSITPVPTLSEADKHRTAIASGSQVPTSSASKPLPTPTKIPEARAAFQVTGPGGAVYQPALAELRLIPTTEMTIDGQKVTGIPLAYFLDKVSAAPTNFVTIEGVTADLTRPGTIRFTVSAVKDTTLFTMGPNGELNLLSSSIPKEQWINWLSGIGVIK